MVATVIDGREIARGIEDDLRIRVESLLNSGITPCLAVVIVGDDPASHVYVRAKERACARLGINSVRVDIPSDAEYEEVVTVVRRLNQDPEVNGILVQSPLPDGMDEIAITDLITIITIVAIIMMTMETKALGNLIYLEGRDYLGRTLWKECKGRHGKKLD